MRAVSASELIEVWERGSGRHPVERALLLLSGFFGGTAEELAELSIGQRDARLLEVYKHLFGPLLTAFVECPQCGERLQYSVPVKQFGGGPNHALGRDLTFETEDMLVRLRLPDSRDLMAAGECTNAADARRRLLEGCVVEAVQNGNLVPAEALPDCVAKKIAAQLAQAEPQAEMLLDLTCAACRHCWQVLLDIESFLWARVSVLSKRLLREVHILARAYGWRERDILALSSARRQSYLEMTGPWLTF